MRHVLLALRPQISRLRDESCRVYVLSCVFRVSLCGTWSIPRREKELTLKIRDVRQVADGLEGMTMPKNADQDVKQMIAGIYDRIGKVADAEGHRFESEDDPDLSGSGEDPT